MPTFDTNALNIIIIHNIIFDVYAGFKPKHSLFIQHAEESASGKGVKSHHMW